MQVIRQRRYDKQDVQLAWRPVEPYCVQEIQYYDLTLHNSGLEGKSDKYFVTHDNSFSLETGIMLQRRKADDTIRETEIPNGTKISPSFIDSDIVASTIPLYELTSIQARYHRIKHLLFDFSLHTPKMEKVRLRGNWINFGVLNMYNCSKLKYLDLSMNYIDQIILPQTDSNDSDNYFTYAYLGHYSNNAPAPRQVINQVCRRAYYSKVSDAAYSAVETKRLNTQTSTGTLYYDNVNYHKLLIDKGWSVEHISTEESVSFTSSNAGDATLDFMTSYHDWDLVIPAEATWLTADKGSGLPSNDVQTITLSATQNTTGSQRSTTIKLRKIKNANTTSNSNEIGTEFHYAAEITVTQP